MFRTSSVQFRSDDVNMPLQWETQGARRVSTLFQLDAAWNCAEHSRSRYDLDTHTHTHAQISSVWLSTVKLRRDARQMGSFCHRRLVEPYEISDVYGWVTTKTNVCLRNPIACQWSDSLFYKKYYSFDTADHWLVYKCRPNNWKWGSYSVTRGGTVALTQRK